MPPYIERDEWAPALACLQLNDDDENAFIFLFHESGCFPLSFSVIVPIILQETSFFND